MIENDTKEPVSASAPPVSVPVVAVAPVVPATQATPAASPASGEENVVAAPATAKKVVVKKIAAKKVVAKKVAETKAVVEKVAAKKVVVKKAAAKKVAKKAVAEKSAIKNASAKNATAKKATAKKVTTKSVAVKKPRLARPSNTAPVVDQAAQKAKKVKLVRDSFTMPGHEYQVLQDIKKASLKAGIEIKKSELFRIGVSLLKSLSTAQLEAARAALTKLRAGRPKK